MGSGKQGLNALLTSLAGALLLGFLTSGLAWADGKLTPSSWTNDLEHRLAVLDAQYPGELGVYVKHLQSGEFLSFRGDEVWYLASGIKIPVAIEVMRGIERGAFSLDSKLTLHASDFVDGAGPTKWQQPGSQVRIRLLLERMLIESDNTASDRLIRLVGLEQVNQVMRELVPAGLGDVTTLADVRRHAYSAFHQRAFELTGDDFFALRNQLDESTRIDTLARLLNVQVSDFSFSDMDSAFAAYYATNLNAGQLSAFSALLEKLVQGQALQADSTAYLMRVLHRVETGNNRIKAGLPVGMRFAHKTGTQHNRTCDLGVAATGDTTQGYQQVVIAACSRGEGSVTRSERALRAIGEAVVESGVFRKVSKS